MGERIFLPVDMSPADLREKAKELTQLQIDRSLGVYRDKWMHLAGYVIEVTKWGNAVSVSVVDRSDASFADYLWFESDHDRLELVNKGDLLTAIGRIEGINGRGLVFKPCELVEISTPETPIALFAPPVAIDVAPVVENGESTSDEAKSKRPLSVAEMERFSQLYIGIYADAAVEGKALEAVRACYPDNQIGRDAFYKIFREIRGPGKRGNPAFRG